jgi:DNA-binding PadR family transcriptional regulator
LAPRNRANPLALALLICLYERPMHPYEAATTMRQRGKHYSVRLNYGSLYAVVESLERRGLIEALETQREGRLPERTVYRLTHAGQVEALEWLSELVSTPVKEYPAFEAALSFLPALPPDQAAELLEERAGRLELEIAQTEGVGEMMQKHALPRLFRIESDFSLALKRSELAFVRKLAHEIRTDTLEGTEWWRSAHENTLDAIPYPQDWDSTIGGQEESQ